MPKHKRSQEERIEKYMAKIRRLQKKQLQCSRSPSQSDKENHDQTDEDVTVTKKREEHEGDYTPALEKCQSPEIELLQDMELDNSLKPDQQASVDTAEIALDIETLTALGKPFIEKQKYGPNINGDLAKLWTPILKKGFNDPKEKLAMLEKYLIPTNCQLLQAPKLNPEILVTVTDTIKNRDRKIENEQQQLGQGITALNRALSLLATNTGERYSIITMLSEASQILSDLHHSHTTTRKKIITPVLDKKFVDLIKDVERDEYLYGSDLSEKIIAMKNAQKTSQSIRKLDNFKPLPKKSGSFNNPVNSRGPLRYQVQKSFNRSGPKCLPVQNPHYKQTSYNQRKPKPEMKPAARK